MDADTPTGSGPERRADSGGARTTGRPRRRPVIHRSQVWTWLALVTVAVVLTVAFVPTATQQVIAFVMVGLAAVAAVALWRISEYRVHVLGPPTSTGSRAWMYGCILFDFLAARIIGGGAPFPAAIAGFTAGVALTLPVLTYATVMPEPSAPPVDDDPPPPP